MCRRKGANKLWHRQPMTNLEAKEVDLSAISIKTQKTTVWTSSVTGQGMGHETARRKRSKNHRTCVILQTLNACASYQIPHTRCPIPSSWQSHEAGVKSRHKEVTAWQSASERGAVWRRPTPRTPVKPFSREGSGLSALKFIFCLKQ